ncbi:MAG: hypothetical protein AAGA58_13315 [Verrucomicrobiota bacterium]
MSIKAAIQTELDNTQFVPGQVLKGRVGWQSGDPVDRAELRLFYYTKGRGTRDVEVVDRTEWQSPSPIAQQNFEFPLPEGPYSFSGKLISLIWALELIVDPGEHTERLEFTLSPSGEEIDLYRYPVPEELDKKSMAKKWFHVERNR